MTQPVGGREQKSFEGFGFGGQVANERGIGRRFQKFRGRHHAPGLQQPRHIEHVAAFRSGELEVINIAAGDAREHLAHGSRAREAIFARLQFRRRTQRALEEKSPGVADDAGVLERAGDSRAPGAARQVHKDFA